jgi:hypothetical protein
MGVQYAGGRYSSPDFDNPRAVDSSENGAHVGTAKESVQQDSAAFHSRSNDPCLVFGGVPTASTRGAELMESLPACRSVEN